MNELAYLVQNHDQVHLSRAGEVVTEQSLIEQIWASNPLLKQYLGSLENPQFILYRIVPQRVRFMREWALNYHDVPPSDELGT